MHRFRSRVSRLLPVTIAGAIVAGAMSTAWSWSLAAAQTSHGVLVDLHGPAELRTRFNADRGNTRLVLLLSPT